MKKLSIGDKIVYPQHGVVEIVDIFNKKIRGIDRQFFRLQALNQPLTIDIPKSSFKKVGIRDIISKAQVDEVFDILGQAPDVEESNWSHRNKINNDIVNSGNIFDIAVVLKNLVIASIIHRNSMSEKRLLVKAKDIMTFEIGLSLGISEEEVSKMIDKKFEKYESEEAIEEYRNLLYPKKGKAADEQDTNKEVQEDDAELLKEKIAEVEAEDVDGTGEAEGGEVGGEVDIDGDSEVNPEDE
jgi:CarD family transcriptional regulator